jgi:hypothetical protein
MVLEGHITFGDSSLDELLEVYMAIQRMISSNVTPDKWVAVQEAIMLLSAKTTLRRLVWVCETCGMIYLRSAPAACECCGATKGLVPQQDTRQEISSHC